MKNFQFSIFNFQFKLDVWLVLLCLFFLATRLYAITTNPPSLYWDEASIGYNAYSVLTTGRDEWGKILPIHFRAFGEFKLSIYVYTVVFTEAVLGVNELAVRLPAVFYSLGSLLLVYALAKLISKKESTALLAALFFAVQPWFFIFSRTGFEVTAGLFFYLLGIWLIFWNSQKTIRYPLAALCFVLSMYSYNSFRIITPLTILVLAVSLLEYPKQVKQQSMNLMIGLVILVLGILPIVRFVMTGGNTRFDQVSIFRDGATITQALDAFLQNYLSHFSPQFLVLPHLESARSLVPGFSQLDLAVFLLIFPGLWWVFKKKSKLGFTFLALVLIAPIPAALTFESPHALRSLSMLPFLTIIAALGVEQILKLVKQSLPSSEGQDDKWRHWVPVFVWITAIGLFSIYFYQFLTIYPKVEAVDWQYPYKEINTQYVPQIAQADNVYISTKLAQPYIYTLFYQKYDPNKFRQEVEYNPPNQWGFSLVRSFGKYHFEVINDISLVAPNSLIFNLSDDESSPNQIFAIKK